MVHLFFSKLGNIKGGNSIIGFYFHNLWYLYRRTIQYQVSRRKYQDQNWLYYWFFM